MNCDFANFPVVEFPNSGVKVEGREVTTRSDRHEYSWAKIKITQEAGSLLAEKVKPNSPVYLRLGGGTIQNRYVFTASSLSMQDQSAWIELYDAKKILEAGNVAQTFHEVTLSDVVSDILDSAQDPNGVITGYSILDQATAEQTTKSYRERFTEAAEGSDADFDGYSGVGGVIDWGMYRLSKLIVGVAPGLDKGKGGFTFDNISPAEALMEVEEMFGVESWVDDSGTLLVGPAELRPSPAHILSTTSIGDYAIEQYNIVQGFFPISHVHVEGTSTTQSAGNGLFSGAKKLRPIGYASIPGGNGGTYTSGQRKRIRDPDTAERAAIGILLREASKKRTGNVVLNGFASRSKEKLPQMQVGNVLIVDDSIKGRCNKTVESGAFLITRVQHTVSIRNGWKVTAEVSAFPPVIESGGVWYLPDRDKEYESLEAYRNDN